MDKNFHKNFRKKKTKQNKTVCKVEGNSNKKI